MTAQNRIKMTGLMQMNNSENEIMLEFMRRCWRGLLHLLGLEELVRGRAG